MAGGKLPFGDQTCKCVKNKVNPGTRKQLFIKSVILSFCMAFDKHVFESVRVFKNPYFICLYILPSLLSPKGGFMMFYGKAGDHVKLTNQH